MTDDELIKWLRQLAGTYKIGDTVADRIEALIHSRGEWQGRADALEKERDEALNKAVLSKACYDGLSSIFLSLQKDCISEKLRADKLEKERDDLDIDLSFYIEDRDFCKEQWLGTEEKLHKLLSAFEPIIEILHKTIDESGRSIEYGEEDPFRMGEWFEDSDIIAITDATNILKELKNVK